MRGDEHEDALFEQGFQDGLEQQAALKRVGVS
jgi:hypothetical protein